MIDWRELKYREELFFRYLNWRLSVHDLDHSHYCKTLVKGMNTNQRCWFSLLFGMTYRTPQAYAYWYTFKDLEAIELEEVKRWNADNWKRTSYGTDARYNKGHFYEQVESIIRWKGSLRLAEKIQELTDSDDPLANFTRLFDSIVSIHKYGRMTSWITCQCLYDTLHLNIDFDNVLIANPNSDSSMKSIWNGYCMLKGHYNRLLGEQYSETTYAVTLTDLAETTTDIMRYREKAQDYIGATIDVFKWESIWCQFKRLFNKKESKEYPGHASGDAVSRYTYFRDNWPEVDWTRFRTALLSQPGLVRGRTYVNDYNKVFGLTGLLLNMHEMYDDMPNAYEALEIDPTVDYVDVLFLDSGLKVPMICV